MLDFKLCTRYKEAESKEHCPFDTVCNLNCYFTNQNISKDYSALQSDYYEVEQESCSYENLKDELSEVEYERDSLENQKNELIELIKYIITISSQEQLNKIENEMTMLDYDWYDIKDKINERIN